MICPQCQTENRSQARFCMTCGTRLAGAVPQPAQHVEPAVLDSSPEPALVSQDVASLSQVAEVEPAGPPPTEPEAITPTVSPSPSAEPATSPAQVPPVAPLESAIQVAVEADAEPVAGAAELQLPSPVPPTPATQAGGETLSPEESHPLPSQPEAAALEPGAETPLTASSAAPLVGQATESTTAAAPADTASRPAGQEPAQEVRLDAAPTSAASAPGPEPLVIGTLVAGRFEITGLLEEAEAGNAYAAVDRGACGQCGAAIEAEDAFCSACGVELAGVPPPSVRLRELAEAPEPLEGAHEDRGRWYVVLPAEIEEPAREASPAEAGGWRLQVGQASDAGQVRELDEDSVLALTLCSIYQSRIGPTLGLFIVADGMGGHEGGEVASKLAVQTIAQQVLQRIIWPELQGERLLVETIGEQLDAAIQAACQQIFEVRQARGSDMGTTLTLALVRDGLAVIANVGDSRTYVWAREGLLQLTRDHSLIADLIAVGEEPPEAVYTHPQRSLIYRNLGDKEKVEVDLFTLELEHGFRLILCCDGVWEMIRNEGIEEVMLREDHPQRAADTLVAWANEAGGEDNLSAIVVNVEQV